jgi:hypothetical protein
VGYGLYLEKESFLLSLAIFKNFGISYNKKHSILTFDTFIKLGLAVEISPKVWREQFTS